MSDPLTIAQQVHERAAQALSDFQSMIADWPPDFRAIMWGAVADAANARRIEAEQEHKELSK